MSESRKGENHPSWKGGISNNPYCPIFSNKEFRSIIYKRDSNTCQLCGCTKQLNHKLTSRKVLTIHHIDGDKMNCDLRNCILVCQRCNTHVENKKLRKFYQYNFQNIMVLKYS